jgi:hypothetical protein
MGVDVDGDDIVDIGQLQLRHWFPPDRLPN